MSKAQTDIRTTSYDAWAARPEGYQGEINDVIAQIRAEDDDLGNLYWPSERRELEFFLGVDKLQSRSPSVEMDQDVRYG